MKFLSRYTRHNVPEPDRKGLDAAGIVLAHYCVYGDIQRIVHGVAWITIFGSRVRLFANNFHEWRSHEWKSLANRITSDHNIVIHGKECIILFLTRYFMSWTHNSSKNHYRSLISPLSLWTVFSVLALWPFLLICDVTQTWGTGIVMSYSSIVLARANWCKGDLHCWIKTVTVDFSLPGIHDLACKKTWSLVFPNYAYMTHAIGHIDGSAQDRGNSIVSLPQ